MECERNMALIFLDLDGTTLDSGKPAKGIIETITELKLHGHIPVIATGRVPHLLYGIEKTLGIYDYIAANGNYVRFGGKVVHERYIEPATVEKMIRVCDTIGADLVMEGVTDYVAYSRNTDLVDKFSDAFGIEYPRIDRTYHETNDVLAFIVFADQDAAFLQKEFPELTFNRSNKFGYDVNPRGDLKAEGIRKLVNHLGYPADQVYAIGDGLNDVSMLQAVRYGIAMGNAFPETKAVAAYVTTDVGDDGVRNALKHYRLI